jgi:hypothetical protein
MYASQVFSDSTDKKILVPSPFKGQVLSCSIFSTILSPEPVTLKQSSEKSLKIYLLIYIHGLVFHNFITYIDSIYFVKHANLCPNCGSLSRSTHFNLYQAV